MRIVLDTNIIVSAFLWNGASARLFNKIMATEIELFSSQTMLTELGNTLNKTKLQSKIMATGIPPVAWVAKYESFCTIVTPMPAQNIAPDPDDDWVIATAIAAHADLIVTGDKPFLGIGNVGRIRIVTGIEALEILDTCL